MQSKSDAQLLRDYAERGLEAAFAEIVHRHTNLVYSAALRLVNSPDSAAEIAQNVFVGLARGAQSLSAQLAAEASLAGWLCRSTRNQALKLWRDDSRRHSRERQAMELLDPISETAPDWASLRPVLDEAMAELTESDYDALVLRFFNNQDLKEVGRALGVSDDTAQKRVARALDKLRENLTRRGVATTGAALSLAISANAVSVAPAGLAATFATAVALAGTTLATTVTATAVKAIAMTTLQKTIVTATIAILAGAGIYEARQAAQLRDRVQTLQQQQAPLAEQVARLSQTLIEATNQLAALRDDNERLNRNTGELLKLRGEVGVLRRQQNSQQDQELVQGKTEREWIKSIVYRGDDSQIELWHSLGSRGIQMLLRALKSSPDGQTWEQEEIHRKTRMCVASLLGDLANHKQVVVPEIIDILKTETDDSVRAIELACFESTFERLGDKEKSALYPEAVRAMESSNTSARNNALVLLQHYTSQSEAVIPLMVKALQDSSPGVRLMAVKALEKVDPQNAAGVEQVAVVVGCLSGPAGDTPGAANDAAIMLGKLHREPELAVPALIQGLQHTDRDVRQNSAVALGKFGEQAKPALNALEKALADADSKVRSQAAAAIASINSAPPAK